MPEARLESEARAQIGSTHVRFETGWARFGPSADRSGLDGMDVGAGWLVHERLQELKGQELLSVMRCMCMHAAVTATHYCLALWFLPPKCLLKEVVRDAHLYNSKSSVLFLSLSLL